MSRDSSFVEITTKSEKPEFLQRKSYDPRKKIFRSFLEQVLSVATVALAGSVCCSSTRRTSLKSVLGKFIRKNQKT
ncbi:hypothetical protein DLM78_14615 [Leptospira stimsonii]|uniref:Uncharacterized protein n=1 Tax=Leptospira stimsonii TaxID=2202203 RepID=A0A8B3CRX2_9LEPT|nr:hypothetical protein DLM78_14615 [Leptospira stimsonii]